MRIARIMATLIALAGLSGTQAGWSASDKIMTELDGRLSDTRQAIDAAQAQHSLTLTRSLELQTELTNISLQYISWLARRGEFKPGEPEALLKRLTKLNSKISFVIAAHEHPHTRDHKDFPRYRR